MGCICSCLLAENRGEHVHRNGSRFQSCICFNCFVDLYTALFQRGQVHAIPSSIQGNTSLTTAASDDFSLSNTYHSPPRPLPYDADLRCSRLRQDGLVSRHEKGSSHSHDESGPLRRNAVHLVLGPTDITDKWDGTFCGKSKEYQSESSIKVPSAELTSAIDYIYPSSEDEDVCPTCLEEYTTENPKIVTQCSHHFHLGCIYEWMERSETCPVCCKVMVFDETT